MQENKIKQAVILCGGLGTRLRPITDTIPKAMVPLLGKPLLEWHIERLKTYGVEEFFINLFYLPDVISDYFGDGKKFGVNIHYSLENPEMLGTAGGVKDFDGKLHGDFFVIYGDVFSLMDYGKMIDAFYARPGIIVMEVIGDNDHPHDSDLVEIDKNLKFLKIHQKPHKTLPLKYKAMRAATFIFNERILSYIPPKTYYEIDHELLPDLLAKGEQIYGYECGEYIKDIGTPERYAAVQRYLEEKRRPAHEAPTS